MSMFFPIAPRPACDNDAVLCGLRYPAPLRTRGGNSEIVSVFLRPLPLLSHKKRVRAVALPKKNFVRIVPKTWGSTWFLPC